MHNLELKIKGVLLLKDLGEISFSEAVNRVEQIMANCYIVKGGFKESLYKKIEKILSENNIEMKRVEKDFLPSFALKNI